MGTKRKIKWCTYSFACANLPQNIGKLISSNENSGYIKYADKQMYFPQCWDMHFVKVFDDLQSAVDFLLKNNTDISDFEIKEELFSSFPDDAKKIFETTK